MMVHVLAWKHFIHAQEEEKKERRYSCAWKRTDKRICTRGSTGSCMHAVRHKGRDLHAGSARKKKKEKSDEIFQRKKRESKTSTDRATASNLDSGFSLSKKPYRFSRNPLGLENPRGPWPACL